MNEFRNMYMSKIYRISSNTMNKKKLKNNYINKGNVSSLMKIVKTADDSYVGLLRLSQHKHKISSMENCRLTKRSTKRFVDGGHKNAFVITNE